MSLWKIVNFPLFWLALADSVYHRAQGGGPTPNNIGWFLNLVNAISLVGSTIMIYQVCEEQGDSKVESD